MVMRPSERFISEYINAGADFVTLHWESFWFKGNLARRLRYIKRIGCGAGLTFNPDAKLNEIGKFIDRKDLSIFQ